MNAREKEALPPEARAAAASTPPAVPQVVAVSAAQAPGVETPFDYGLIGGTPVLAAAPSAAAEASVRAAFEFAFLGAAALCVAAAWAASRIPPLRFDGDSAVSVTPVG